MWRHWVLSISIPFSSLLPSSLFLCPRARGTFWTMQYKLLVQYKSNEKVLTVPNARWIGWVGAASCNCTQKTHCFQFIQYKKPARTRATGRRKKAGKQKLGNAPLSSAFCQWICGWTERWHFREIFCYLALCQESCTFHARVNGAGAQRRHQGGLVATQSE